jgi:RNA polymerase sigma factor (sigma-70 family)
MINPTPEEYEKWRKFALKTVKRMKWNSDHLSLGPDTYADEAIEKLIMLNELPDNVEAWLTTVLKRQNLDHALRKRKFTYRDDPDISEEFEAADQLALRIMRGMPLSLAGEVVHRAQLAELLDFLSEKDRNIIQLSLANFGTDEIAQELGYASSKVVANRVKIIKSKLKERFGENGEYFF